jgi:8-oxo-dGTP diphosphatase
MTTSLERTCLCFVIVDEKVLLLERQNTWFENGKYIPPGGLVDVSEEPAVGAARELFEETGLIVDAAALTLVRNYQSEDNNRFFDNYHFLTRICEGIAENKEPTRHSNIGWFALDQLPANTSQVVYDTLKHI